MPQFRRGARCCQSSHRALAACMVRPPCLHHLRTNNHPVARAYHSLTLRRSWPRSPVYEPPAAGDRHQRQRSALPALQHRWRTVYNGRQPMHPPAGIELVIRRARLNLRLRLIAAFAAGVLAVGCGAFVADPSYRATQLPDDVTELFEVQPVVANPDADTVWIFEQGGLRTRSPTRCSLPF